MTKIRLQDVAQFSKGQQINGKELSDVFEFPFLNGGVHPSGKWKSANAKANTITISEGGNSCGHVNWIKTDFWCGAHCYYLFDVQGDGRYLYYALKSQQDRLMAARSGCCMPNLKKSDLANFQFNYCWNTDVQRKIVTVLDGISKICDLSERVLLRLDELVKSRFEEAA